MLKTIIIEDNHVQRNLLCSYAEQLNDIELVGEFSDVNEAVVFLQGHHTDLIILDVELPSTTGVEFLENYQPNAHIILVSSSEKYAINGYQLNVDDYLLKPVSFSRFSQAVKKVMDRMEGSRSKSLPFLFIKDRGVFNKVLIDEILYVQSASEYVTIHTKEKRVIMYSSMDGILSKLNLRFMRIHRSSIVNLDKIDKIDGNTVEVNGHQLVISKTYHDGLMHSLGLKVK
jgi:DNA-binding LytR/AlgR family response regulator